MNMSTLSQGNAEGGIKVVGNTVYFYSKVTALAILELNVQIQKLINIDPIYVRIHSYGGEVYAGLAGLDVLKGAKNKVITIVDGISASAATFLSLAGDTRYMAKHSHILIHQLRAGMWGTYEECNDQKKNLDSIMQTVKKIYLNHTKIPQKKLNEIIKRDLILDAKTCLKYGITDKII